MNVSFSMPDDEVKDLDEIIHHLETVGELEQRTSRATVIRTVLRKWMNDQLEEYPEIDVAGTEITATDD